MNTDTINQKLPPPVPRKVRKVPVVLHLIVTIYAVVGFINLAPQAFFMPFAAISLMTPEVRFAKVFWSHLLADQDFKVAYQMTAASFRESHTEDEFATFQQLTIRRVLEFTRRLKYNRHLNRERELTALIKKISECDVITKGVTETLRYLNQRTQTGCHAKAENNPAHELKPDEWIVLARKALKTLDNL